ncbi:FxLYD domain-containing protein [Neobacillus novalis]|uniref:FxLYD domain-containing protein n=2 Tax=Neobacillus novalis TaxID=220687 RepID=A0AA95MKP6_9BACI|nr:FxLYD domain-containing protein [Neobacillus novalis]WHY85702.1 FxLYD domain-containing protein [Neobacillus novalis]
MTVILPFLLLTACGQSAEYKKSIKNGENAISDKKYQKAVEAFAIAVKEDPNDEVAKKELEYSKSLLKFEKQAKDQLNESNQKIGDLNDQITNLKGRTSEELENQLATAQSTLSEKDKKIGELEGELSSLREFKKQIDQENAQKAEQLAQKQETRNNPVQIKITSFTENTSFEVVEGELKNISDISLKFVQIRVLFKDDNGNIIDSKETYGQSSTLLANAMTKFSARVKKDPRITNATAEIIDFRTE